MHASKEKLFLGGAALFFLAAYLWFPFAAPPIFNSPDETANYFFTRQLAESGDFFSSEPLNFFLSGAVRPRSISWNGYTLAPQGFVGLPLLYGWFARIFGTAVVKFFTPALAILGALAFYNLIKKIFNRRVAAVSFILLLSFPVYWYYASRYFYSNVPFVSFLIIAAWAAVSGALHKNGALRHLVIFCAAFSAALALRPNEAVWILPVLALNLWIFRHGISGKKIFYSVLMMGFAALPVLSATLFFYGNIFGSGYTLDGAVDIGPSAAVASGAAWGEILAYGFHPAAIIKNVYGIFIKYFWQYSTPALIGFLIFLFGKKRAGERSYVISAVLSVAWLIAVYGSGVFLDNPNGGLTFGDSHFRYWLPVFIFMLPLIGIAADKIIFRLRPVMKFIAFLASFAFVAIMSVYLVFFSRDDGLLAVKENLEKNYAAKEAVLKITGPDDVVITGRQDKIFFPERRVLYTQKIADPQLFFSLKKLKNKNFYIYAIGPTAEEFYTMNNITRIYGFRLTRVAIFGKEVLYKLEKIDDDFSYFSNSD